MNIKKIFLSLLYALCMLLIIPVLITIIYKSAVPLPKTDKIKNYTLPSSHAQSKKTDIIVYNPETEVCEEILFDEYLKGVVAAEMPASFEIESLKAQAVAARTYAMKHARDVEAVNAEEIGQAYITLDEMKKNWGEKFPEYYEKISDAVLMTKDEILTFNDEPIEAVFHSTSAGITENSENVWGGALPYLRSVDSSADKEAPGYISEISIKKTNFFEIINQNFPNFSGNSISIPEYTAAGYVKTVKIGNASLSGIRFREIFNLRSSCFSIEETEDSIFIRTKGYGHGAGMSQYGANFMAKSGKSYKDILAHYYTGAQLNFSQ